MQDCVYQSRCFMEYAQMVYQWVAPWPAFADSLYILRWMLYSDQGLWASSLQFTSPLEFNAIFRDGFTLRYELTAGSEIRDPVPAKFKHVTDIVTCTCTMLWLRHVRAGTEISIKLTSNPRLSATKYTTFSFPTNGALASNICLSYAPTYSCIQLYIT